MEQIKPGTKLHDILSWVQDMGGSDLHLQEGKPARYRIDGHLMVLAAENLSPLTRDQILGLLSDNFSPTTTHRIDQEAEVDLSLQMGETRWRANFSKQQARQSCSFRIVPKHNLRLRDLRLPQTLKDILKLPRGLVLLTGPTGQGKSTTVRALIQEINTTQAMRIITIEDPIEYIFDDDLSQFEQREVGIDTASFADGIRNAMRQDPNVIFVGEIRDRESIFTAMQAAETGHLVFTTLHADSAAQAIGRIREYYPASEQSNISVMLGRNINMIVCQRLIPDINGQRVPCVEIMKRDRTVQQAIETNELNRLTEIIEICTHQGMHSFDQYLTELMIGGIVPESTAKTYAANPHRLEMLLAGYQASQGILLPERR
jgi:twitching motility protein PilT